MASKHRVFVTGMGQVSALGYDVDNFWRSVSNGESAIKPWQPRGVEQFPVKYAAAVDDGDFLQACGSELGNAPRLERRGQFGLVAARRAYRQAGLDTSLAVGCAACSGVPEVHDAEIEALQQAGSFPDALGKLQPAAVSGLTVSNDSMVAAIADDLDLRGPVLNINGACAGASQAIGMAFQAVRRGEVSAMLAGGADSVMNVRVMGGLHLLGATASGNSRGQRLCRPFDRARSGLVAGEGAAFLLLESEDSARERGATVFAELLGYGASLDAYKVTAPHPEGEGALNAMRNALSDSGLDCGVVDYINAHGTSTPLNDVVETKAIKKLFADGTGSVPPISSTKSMIGHWISAAGAPEAMATVLALHHGLIPPTVNLDSADPECDLDYVPHTARKSRLRYALSNSFGFGGINASLLFGACFNV